MQEFAATAQTAEQPLPAEPAARPLPPDAPAPRYFAPEQAVEPERLREPPVRRHAPSRTSAQGSRWRLGLILLAAPLVIFLGVYAIVALNTGRSPPQGIGQTAGAPQPGNLPAAKAAGGKFDKLITETGGPDETALSNIGDTLASLEKLFTGQARLANGRKAFRESLVNTAPDSPARLSYLEVNSDRVRLRSEPAESGAVLQVVRAGAYVRVQERSGASGWCQVRVPEGRAGWMKCDFLKPIAEFKPSSVPRAASR